MRFTNKTSLKQLLEKTLERTKKKLKYWKKPVSFFDEVINVVQFCWSNQVDKLIPSKHINVESTMKQSLLSTFIKVVSTLIFD